MTFTATAAGVVITAASVVSILDLRGDSSAPPSNGGVGGAPPSNGGVDASPPPRPDRVARVLQRISEEGRVLYNPPNEMRLGQAEVVEVRITRDEVTDLTEGLAGSGEPVQEQLPVADAMVVELLGPDFDIDPLSPERQLVGGQPFNEWAWRIKPQRAGTTFLRLNVSIEIPKTEKLEGLSPIVLSREIHVDVDPVYAVSQFLGRNWQALLMAAIAAAGLLFGSGILASRRKRSRADA
jgi:hypothetical protein